MAERLGFTVKTSSIHRGKASSETLLVMSNASNKIWVYGYAGLRSPNSRSSVTASRGFPSRGGFQVGKSVTLTKSGQPRHEAAHLSNSTINNHYFFTILSIASF